MPLTGRGGYGNYVAKSKKPGSSEHELESVPSTPAPIQTFSSPTQTFRAGRGGWGNNIPIERMRTLSPTEYLEEAHKALDVEPESYSVGRGGAGNIMDRNRKNQLQPMFSGSSTESENAENTRRRRFSPFRQTSPRVPPSPPHSPVLLSPVSSMPPATKFNNDLQPTFSSSLWSKLKTTLSN
ncbi:hypothetical protein AWJ20_4427 [Sugiyamaella lignohabitans]|uniref:Uncharacterized protein n=1 Tax=Sugiyamaella lignohabitans TaxID=796027 RepID=A0A167CF41_9ASCO|nr:uncharacterized protein AWJ20_4427 [Sugiyamaella lignohabitans]ANB11606.1 hypothetical protein AWJ20_4427 [Sugiyamaella lignohabitans]